MDTLMNFGDTHNYFKLISGSFGTWLHTVWYVSSS